MMIKKLVSALVRPPLEYSLLEPIPPAPDALPESEVITLLYDSPADHSGTSSGALLHIGDTVKTGQKLVLFEGDDTYIISSVTGIVHSLTPLIGDFGRQYTAIRIDVSEDETFDDQFEKMTADPSLDMALGFLNGVPGSPPLKILTDPEKPIDTLVVYGLDNDLFCTTNQYALYARNKDIKSGIRILKQITGIDRVIILVPRHFVHSFGEMGAELKAVDTNYPSTHPILVAGNVLGKTVPAGQGCDDIGIAFFNAEAVASIGRAFDTGRIPVTKTLTLANKDGLRTLISVRIGTPVSDILAAADLTLNEKDRIIFGGPMTGSAIYSLDQPVQPDTDVIFLQDRSDIPAIADSPCINCGECIQVCPAMISVNMLVRYLGAGQYEEAAEQYDLHSCLECGFCSYVCVSRIPIYQYIRLAKYELARTQSSEETDA